MPDGPFGMDDYTVGWVCALPLEMAAAKAMLDEIHPNLAYRAPADNNSYGLGRVQGHNVVIACLPAGVYGTTPAATVAKDMLRTFKSIRFGLMVGIGGGAPSPLHDIRLGDLVVSQPSGTTGGVIQYDRGKDGGKDQFERTGSLNAPPNILLTATGRLQADHSIGDSRVPEFIAESFQKYKKMLRTFSSPGESDDCLFEAEYEHVSGDSGCDQCDRARSVQRDARNDANPVIHYGNIASGNRVIKSATTRNGLSKELGVLCFEMEAAGLMQDFPCLVIRGICDYADSHKNKKWQGYGAVVAAAFAKELLSVILPEHVLGEKAVPQLVTDPMLQAVAFETKEIISKHAMEQESRYENEKYIECHRAFKTSRYEHFKNNNPDRVPGTCRWVLEHPNYQKWQRSSHDDLLWISADPGCGKSVLAKALIDEELENTSDHTVCYFFFKDNEDQNSLSTALSAILHQLFDRSPHLLRHATKAFERNGEKIQHEVDELWRILLNAAMDVSAKSVTCVLDALDECQEESRRKLVRLLTNFYCQHPAKSTRGFQLKFLVTSRPYHDIEISFDDITSELPFVRLAGEESNADISEEINLVIRQKVAAAGKKLHIRRDVRDRLEAKLLATQNRTYLWLHLVWEKIESSLRRTEKALEKLIDTLPETVEDAYERILARNTGGDQRGAKILLHIIVGARRPLTLSELDIAFRLAMVSPGRASRHQDLDLDDTQLKAHIRELCGLFIFISDNRVYLIHQTAKEFLIARGPREALGDGPWRHSLPARQSSKIMTEICVWYLSFHDLRDESYGKSDDVLIDIFPLLEYASVNWPAHYRDMGEADEDLFNRLYDLYDKEPVQLQPWVSIFWKATAYYSRFTLDELNVLHLAATTGHSQVAQELMAGRRITVDVRDENGATPLFYAAGEGQNEMVKFLLKQGADINAQYEGFGSALPEAVENGHSSSVQLLLENGADVNARDEFGEYSLPMASYYGHSEITKLLLEYGADVNARDEDGECPLTIASFCGYSEITKILLEYGADVNAQDGKSSNALVKASYHGYSEIVKLLLEKGADVTAQGIVGRYYGNALQMAFARGHDVVMKLLLDSL